MTHLTATCMYTDYRGYLIVARATGSILYIVRDGTLIAHAPCMAQAKIQIDNVISVHERDCAVMNDGVVGSMLGARKSAFIGLSRKAPAFEHGIATERAAS